MFILFNIQFLKVPLGRNLKRISRVQRFQRGSSAQVIPVKETGIGKFRKSLRAGFTRLLDLPNRQQRGKDAGQEDSMYQALVCMKVGRTWEAVINLVSLEQCCPIELSAQVEIFCICDALCSYHWPHVALGPLRCG